MVSGALKLLNQKEWIDALPDGEKKFELPWNCAKGGSLGLIDIHFAKKMLQPFPDADENAAAFLSILMALSRMGHLSLVVDKSGLMPDLKSLIFDPEECKKIEKMALLGAVSLPDDLVEVMEEDGKIPVKPLCRFEDSFYLQRNWVFETRFIYHLKRLQRALPELELTGFEADDQLNNFQQEAVIKASRSSISMIAGGPGTGKTYTAARLVNAFLKSLSPSHREQCNIILAAPTGKAAAHLEAGLYRHIEKSRNIKCSTLHALLGIRSSFDFSREGSYIFADLVIIDECSMIDVRLFSYLLASLKEGARLVLMGDADQLPPVESGSLFADLIKASQDGFPLACTHLQKCMRSDQRNILELASSINQGNGKEVINKIFGQGMHVDLGLKQKDTRLIHKKIWEHVKDNFPYPSDAVPNSEHLLQCLDQFRILSCIRQGPLGVDVLNQMIAQNYLSEAQIGQWVSFPIIVISNNYTMDLYNGDVGVLVKRHGYNEDYAIFWNKDGKVRNVPALALPSFEYAYCLSVHKSQGSEYQKILLLIPHGSEVFGKEVLYTAATRARKQLEIDGDEETILKAVGSTCRKFSGINKRLKGGMHANPC
jgi:exodeoxyribonuclease V alpha subunit